MRKSIREITVISQDQHSLTIFVESTAVDEALFSEIFGNKIKNGFISRMLWCGTFDAARFVQEQNNCGLRSVLYFDGIHANNIFCFVDSLADCCDCVVHGNATGLN